MKPQHGSAASHLQRLRLLKPGQPVQRLCVCLRWPRPGRAAVLLLLLLQRCHAGLLGQLPGLPMGALRHLRCVRSCRSRRSRRNGHKFFRGGCILGAMHCNGCKVRFSWVWGVLPMHNGPNKVGHEGKPRRQVTFGPLQSHAVAVGVAQLLFQGACCCRNTVQYKEDTVRV